MRLKKIMLVALLLLVILTIGAVSAADDNATLDNLAVGENLSVESSADESDEVLGEVATFSDIDWLIYDASAGDVIELTEDFYYKDGFFKDGVSISKSLTIDGKDYTLDAGGEARFFKVQADNVILKNIVFKNGYLESNYEDGGAIYLNDHEGLVIENCTFINCSLKSDGGVVYIGNSYDSGNISCSIVDCKFVGCSRAIDVCGETYEGNLSCSVVNSMFSGCSNGAIKFDSGHDSCNINCSVLGCSFNDCSAVDGGAIYLSGFINGIISDCSFIRCSAGDGGAIYFYESPMINFINCSIVNNDFVNCSADDGYGGAICFSQYFEPASNGVNSNVVNCRFSGCSAEYGGAIYVGEDVTVRVITSNFENNHADASGAAISGGLVFDCTFRKNTSPDDETSDNPKDMIPDELIPENKDYIFEVVFPQDAEGTIEFFINGTSIKTVEIVRGIATIDLSQYRGVLVVSFIYSGDANYPSFEKNASFITTIITAKSISVLYNSGKSYSITVYEFDDWEADVGTEVVIKSNNKAFRTLKTKDKGIASFTITQAPGTYKLSITSLNRTVTKTLTVKHLLSLNSVTVKKSAKKLVLTAKLAKLNGKYLKGKKITFKFNGKKYTAKTDKKGVAKVTIKSKVLKKLKVGKKITYQATYNSKDTIKKTVKVKK